MDPRFLVNAVDVAFHRGGSNGKLDPNASVTRAEVAKMLFTLW